MSRSAPGARTGEGWFDGWGLMQAFRKKARELGADYIAGEVDAFDMRGGRILAAQLKEGTAVAGDVFVNCAGASGGRRHRRQRRARNSRVRQEALRVFLDMS